MDNNYNILDPMSEEELTSDELLLLYRLNLTDFSRLADVHPNTVRRAREGKKNVDYGTKVKIRQALQVLNKETEEQDAAN